ncbi:MAG: 3-hydroxyacyl-CoA dehydrogenase NAD-binding domain-containing protein [Gammaproteobacteria bacterium]|nr:3-hydroxyacyl-CoA dehydrogenase NAD-binding domain-containing protein [Gammaproteobacteria bacterium]
MDTIKYEIQDSIAIVTFDTPDSPVNVMSLQWQEDMTVLSVKLCDDKQKLHGVILRSAKSSFFAGADLKNTLKIQPGDYAQAFKSVEQVKKNFRTIETLGIPVVACLNGSALGGGWELALAAHARVALNRKNSEFGLPELTLGLIPGASGITKMVRLLGLQKAQEYLLESKLFGVDEAVQLKLVDCVVETEDDLVHYALTWIKDHPNAQQPWDQKNYKMPGPSVKDMNFLNQLTLAPAIIRKKSQGLYPAIEMALCAMMEGAQVDFDTALRIESRYLAKLLTLQVTKNMIQAFFFDLGAIRAKKSRPKESTVFVPTKVGVIGAGMMGSGIAYAQIISRIPTILIDQTQELAQKGRAHAEKLLEDQVIRHKLTSYQKDEILQRIEVSHDLQALSGCDLIIEAVFENSELKAQITKDAECLLNPNGFFASNTSTIPITKLAQASQNPTQFIGIHFFSPVHKMRLVEIIKGKLTDAQTVAQAYDYVLALGKIPIVVNDSRGFFTSRTFGTFVAEGVAMLEEGIPASVIENSAIQAGMPVGPLAVLDETSLALSVQVLEQNRRDEKELGLVYQASKSDLLIERMVKEFNRPGRAGGGGFYEYFPDGSKQLWPKLSELFLNKSNSYNISELKDRFLVRQSIEVARCLAEGVLTTVYEANIGSIMGIGFPAWTGGAMQYIYARGVENFMKQAEDFANVYGSRFNLTGEVKECIRRHHR